MKIPPPLQRRPILSRQDGVPTEHNDDDDDEDNTDDDDDDDDNTDNVQRHQPLQQTPRPVSMFNNNNNNNLPSAAERNEEFFATTSTSTSEEFFAPSIPSPSRSSFSFRTDEDYYYKRSSSMTTASAATAAAAEDASEEFGGGVVVADGEDFAAIASFPSRPPRLRDRTVSTAVRLRRQGFTQSRSGLSFAVRSIRRDSDDWRGVIQPFVSDLAFRSLVSRRYQSEVSFRPYTCHAAVLFIDLSSYSKITSAIADRGAHALSSIANAYFSRILKIVHRYGGDVVKFAGDAVLVVWEGTEPELGTNVMCAAQCAMEIQEKAGSHPVEGTLLEFHVHIGLCCGLMESEIFEAPIHNNMQRLYHSVGGESLYEISELVDMARAGEICISQNSIDFLGARAVVTDLHEESLTGAKLLKELKLDIELLETMEAHIEKNLADRMLRRNKDVEEDFIHPTVLRLLSHGGRSPTQISQMRNLCVLFIAMTSSGSSVNWLMEVQGVLDRHRCPIVQIIDDDKGVHIVAAVNLYETIPETSLCGLGACRVLVEKQVGCAIGVATGKTYCGVTGSSSVACRWDITGPPAVRAARLMQYALANDLEVAVDESVYNDTRASILLEVQNSSVDVKGSKSPIAVYTLSDSTIDSAMNILETVHAHVHDKTVKEIQDFISNPERRRNAVVVTGMALSGKKIVCQRAAGYADLVPFLHVADEHGGLLQLARTIATWFSFSDIDDVQYLASSVMDHLGRGHWCRAHDECLELVNLAIEYGLHSCFLVDRIQFLDEFSLSLIRECLYGRGRRYRRSSSMFSESSHNGETDTELAALENGSICFLCVHVPLYNWKTADNVVKDLERSNKKIRVPVFEILEARLEELRNMFRDLSDMEVEERWLDVYSETSGYCAGYFIERAAASRVLSGKLWSEGKRGYSETSEKLVLSIPPGLVRMSRLLNVTQVSADVAMRFHQIYDELPPLFQTLCKVLAIATRKSLYKLPRFVLWEVLNDLIAEGVEANVLTIVLDEMVEMFLLKIDSENDEDVVSFRTPALADIALEVTIPVQFFSIATALLERLEPIIHTDFRVPFLMAELLHELKNGQEETKKQYWNMSWKSLESVSAFWPRRKVEKWKELIRDEISAAGYNVSEVLGEEFCVNCRSQPSVGTMLPLVKIYSAPVSLGPMGHTFTVLCRNTFHEWRVFHGATDEECEKLRTSTQSAADRYLNEMVVVEDFLKTYGLAALPDDLERERQMISQIMAPASSGVEVQAKAVTILEDFVPNVIEPRLERLYNLICKLNGESKIPDVITNGPEAIYKAYKHLMDPGSKCSGPTCAQDAAQKALMTLASMNWKPRPVPEYLPIIHYQTVARLRNKTLKRLSDNQRLIFRHQQTIEDLKVFLVLTPLLYEAQAKGKC